MSTNTNKSAFGRRLPTLGVALVLTAALFAGTAQAATLTVIGVNKDGTRADITASTRWTLEVDRTYHVRFDAVGNPIPDNDTSSVNFHPSYMPVAATGSGASLPTAANTDYFVSVMPSQAGQYSIGGTAFTTDATGAANVVVTLNQLPLPTAQITVFVFEDDYPTNNAPDLPEEQPTVDDCTARNPVSACMAGFSIVLEDAGGRYGASAGTQMMDAFGNPLGTTYDAAGNVAIMGTGVIKTDAEGMATIKNLAPGKYGIIIIPPANQGWQQTTTIEGTKVIDAWVKANEPPFFQEFGPPGPHVFMGFVQPKHDATVLTGGATISGRVVNQHLSKPPDYSFYNGVPRDYTTCWVALNTNAGLGAAAHVARCNSDNTFSITGVPAGSYQIGIWDENLDQVFAAHTVNVGADLSCNGGGCNLTDIPVFSWFTATHHYVFLDKNGNGYRDIDPMTGELEPGVPEQNVNLRWRDGTINQAAPTDGEGFVPFDEVFPFFAWQVAEVDFARFKATGVTVTVDDGGPVNPNNPLSFGGVLNPQPQTCTQDDVTDGVPGCTAVGQPRVNPQGGGVYQRTYTGPVLTLGYQGFLGQTSVFEWGKRPYEPGENGGVSGVVFYDTTRAENDPRYAGPEVWQPGIPGVTVNLYDATGTTLLATAQTDSWDDSVPTGCQGEPFVFDPDGTGPVPPSTRDCYDGLRVFNQVRPAVFDGGYAFTECLKTDPEGPCVGIGTPLAVLEPIPQGQYVVEVVPPAYYKVGTGADKNVDFGDEFVPSQLLLPPQCVGDPYVEAGFLTLFPGVENPSAGLSRNRCNRKLVNLASGQNGAADFFLFTDVPVSGHINGFILDDTANEFDPNSPNFGEKYAPPWLPVSIRDWTGREITRVYSDQYGVYQALVPSTASANLPQPSGMSPNMLTVCLNSPWIPVYDAAGAYVGSEFDPRFNPQYSQFCYTFQYMPGVTTYLDTPVVPTAAFAGTSAFPLDCELPTGTPVIRYANDEQSENSGFGPYVTGAGDTLYVFSMGQVAVPNPSYGGVGSSAPKTIDRDYGFGATAGQVWIGSTQIPAANVAWSDAALAITIPAGVTTGQLKIVRGDNQRPSVTAVTVTVGGTAPIVVGEGRTYKTIQSAIDAAPNGSLITVEPGNWEELVVMWKPVRLQGWGAGSTVINAVKVPAEKLVAWRAKIQGLITSGAVNLLPAQEAVFGGLEPDVLFTEEGPGVIVLSRNRNVNQGGFGLVNGQPNARIDGFTVTGGDNAGGIFVNAYADFLAIANNRVVNNAGIYGGGIRIGHPFLTNDNAGYVDADNDSISITNNHVAFNGGQGAFGGGVSLCTGTDGYRVTGNFICGNFSLGEGGGIGHIGVSKDALIADNAILFNETFNQGVGVHGGGIFIGGGAPLPGQTLSEGSGSVRVVGNLILGNLAGAGDGGGVRLSRVNGQDVDAKKNNPDQWYAVTLVNNIIANNVAGLAGGGISLFDTVRSSIVHNTIVNNDSTATAGAAFTPGTPNQSNPQPAGVVSRALTTTLFGAIGTNNQVDPKYKVPYSNPDLINNIIWHNRSFYFQVTAGDPPVYGLIPDLANGDQPVYADLAVLGVAGQLNPTFSLLTSATGYAASNFTGNPAFLADLVNMGRDPQTAMGEQTTIQAPAAFDEGGNFIKVQFGPLTLTDVANPATLYRNYHLGLGSVAIDKGTPTLPGNVVTDAGKDFDGQTRPTSGTAPDAGADETPTSTARMFRAQAGSTDPTK
ncbi:MAG: hypothetical protein AB1625_01865 [Acidobacteriota bacterium]